jgi:hypothetical protein
MAQRTGLIPEEIHALHTEIEPNENELIVDKSRGVAPAITFWPSCDDSPVLRGCVQKAR